jgi:hypothetical protein
MESCQKPFLGCPQYFPPQKNSIFFQEEDISQEREFVASQIGDYKKMFLIVQTYLGGQPLCSPHLTPQIQCLPEPSIAQSADESKLPPHLNLCESGLCQLECVKALQQKAHNPAHVAWGTRTKRSVSALTTLFSFVSHVTILDHELLTHVIT